MKTLTLPAPVEGLSADEERSFRPEETTYFVEVIGAENQVLRPIDRDLVVGTDPDCEVRVEDPTVSRRHLTLQRGERGVWVRDLGSRNGTFHNGTRIEGILARRETTIGIGKLLIRIIATPSSNDRRPGTFGEVVGESPSMQAVFASLQRVAPSMANVLLLGETGTGKDVIARAIHQASPRKHRPFVVVDCGSLSASVIESELFGHVKGSFTGAIGNRDGAFVAATGGTIFLDEVGELPAELQPRLLRALESRVIRRVGDNEDRPIDVRFIAATHQNLEDLVDGGRFRRDLFFRLAVVTVNVPPLRERRTDIPLLVATLLARAGRPEVELSEDLKAKFLAHDWPGNVRELRNVIDRVIYGGTELELTQNQAPGSSPLPYKEAKEQLIESFSRVYFTKLFEANGRSVAAMARAAGVARTYAHELVKRYGLK